MRYPIAERFKAPQGEGLYTGTPMAFIRMVGCSVGKGTCTHCDTDFDKIYPNLDGGMYSTEELMIWVGEYRHICITGGEPLDRDLRELITECVALEKTIHIETSGTTRPEWLEHALVMNEGAVWLTVSPKPHYLPSMIEYADEVKVILGGLGDGPGWPNVRDAKTWAHEGKLVYVQPRNNKFTTDTINMAEAVKVVSENPELRLSAQFHKYLRTR